MGPFLQSDVEVWLCPVDVDEGGEDDGSGDLSAGDDVGDERRERWVFAALWLAS